MSPMTTSSFCPGNGLFPPPPWHHILRPEQSLSVSALPPPQSLSSSSSAWPLPSRGAHGSVLSLLLHPHAPGLRAPRVCTFMAPTLTSPAHTALPPHSPDIMTPTPDRDLTFNRSSPQMCSTPSLPNIAKSSLILCSFKPQNWSHPRCPSFSHTTYMRSAGKSRWLYFSINSESTSNPGPIHVTITSQLILKFPESNGLPPGPNNHHLFLG